MHYFGGLFVKWLIICIFASRNEAKREEGALRLPPFCYNAMR